MKLRKKNIFKFLLLLIFSLVVFNNVKNLLSSTQPITTSTEQLSEISLIEVDINQLEDNKFLMLVNSENQITDKPSEFDLTSAYKIIPVSTSDVSLNPATLDAVTQLFNDASKLGFDDLYVSSGYRNYEEQKAIYESSEDKSYVQAPGSSEHHTGLAADISILGVSGKQLGQRKEGKWLAESSWKYGFILRYPDDKKDITKISYEPWHFRFVGIPHAYYCYENNLCFEEYIEFLKNSGGYSITIDNVTYSIFYEIPENDIIYIPKGLSYEISSDNTGGVIITAIDII